MGCDPDVNLPTASYPVFTQAGAFWKPTSVSSKCALALTCRIEGRVCAASWVLPEPHLSAVFLILLAMKMPLS